jgi:hypothetical protein
MFLSSTVIHLLAFRGAIAGIVSGWTFGALSSKTSNVPFSKEPINID